MTQRLRLRCALGKHEHVAPLKDGRVRSDRVAFEFVDFEPLPKAFRTMVRGGDLDVAEMALTTHLLADAAGKPLSALPIPLWRRLHHANLVCRADSAIAGPRAFAGGRVGVRAYAQTTGVWLRGILATEYGLDPDTVTWVTMEDAHVAEYRDPSNCERAAPGSSLRDLLNAGDLLAIMGERDVDPAGVRPVIADADAAGEDWSRRTGVFPVNHIVSVRSSLLAEHPWLAGELMDLFERARLVSGGHEPPYGLEPNRAPMQMLLDFAFAQHLTARPTTVDEVFRLPVATSVSKVSA